MANLHQFPIGDRVCANRSASRAIVCICLPLLALGSFANASPGDYDNSFGIGGIAQIPAPPATGAAFDLAQAPDGSLVVAGFRGAGPLLAKLTAAGRLDSTFAANGFDNIRRGTKIFQNAVLVAPFPASQFTVVETHGDPCIGAPFFCFVSTFKDVFVRRINSNGVPDPTYGTNGTTLIPFSDGSFTLWPTGALTVVTLQPQLVAPPILAVVELQPNGQRDAAFELRALDAINCGFAPMSFSRSVTHLAGSKLLVAISMQESASGPQSLCVSRLNGDGSLDTSFANRGHLLLQNAALNNRLPFRMLVRGDGRILIVMFSFRNNPIDDPAFVWLTPDGALDAGFGTGGLTDPAPVLVAHVVDVSLQLDDKILVVGYNSAAAGPPTFPLDYTKPILSRLESTGAKPDVSFGPSRAGFMVLTTNAGWLSPQKVVAGNGGGIFVMGTAVAASPPPSDPLGSGDFALAKIQSAADTGSGGGGGGGGGCGMIAPRGPVDPTLPALLALSLIGMIRVQLRKRRHGMS